MYTENIWNKLDLQGELSCAYSLNMRNESLRIVRIRRMSLFVYLEYAERIYTYTENRFQCSLPTCANGPP
jgi:hypothetical protein